VPIQTAVDLRTVSECAESTLEDVQSLNPELRRLATPDRAFTLNVPLGKGEALTQCLDKIPPDQRVRFRTHVVGRGQTLAAIGRRYGVRISDIAEANGISTKRRLSTGAELIIPIEYTGATSTRTASATRSATRTASAAPSRGMKVSYKIKPGDTLSTIASQYGTSVRDLRSWNRIRGSGIIAGETLTIYTDRKF
jgi:membrane-bound lytic murein transglycosylase D